MKENLFRNVISLLEDAGVEPYAYSGRGMFGRRCVAVNVDGGSLWDIAVAVGMAVQVDHEGEPNFDQIDAVEEMRSPKTDTMGKGMVVYWPDIPWSDKEVEDGEQPA